MNAKSRTAPSECAIFLMSHGWAHSDTDKAVSGVRLWREDIGTRNGSKTPSLLLQVMNKVLGPSKHRRIYNAVTSSVAARG